MFKSKEHVKETIDIEALRKKVSEEAQSGSDKHRQSNETSLNATAKLVAHQLRHESHSPAIIQGLIGLGEFVFLCAIASSTAAVFAPSLLSSTLSVTLMIILFGGAATVGNKISHAYELHLLRWPALVISRLIGTILIATLLMATCAKAFNLSGQAPWAFYANLFIASAIILISARFAIARAIRHWGRNGVMERRAIIVGGGQAAKDVIRSIESQDSDIRICGIFDDRDNKRSPSIVAGYPKLGTFAELVEFGRQTKLDMLIIALPVSAEQRILQLLRKLWVLPVDIRIASHSSDMRFRPRAYRHRSEVPMLDVFHKPIADWDSVSKRIFDIVFSLIALSLTWPIMLGAAIAVKATSKGPILFVQKRHGFNNDTINVLKFRSMYVEAADPTAKKAVTKNDPRVTPVGRFIRRTSIDELPQLFNVLRGDLSLVGPRPHAVHAQTGSIKYDEVVEHYFARHKVKPGVTGWAQINGLRGEIDHGDKIKSRTAYDLYYIENWSLWFDFKILVMTPISLFRSGNAY